MNLDAQQLVVSAAVAGTLIAWVRNLPLAIGRWLRSQLLVSVEVRDPDLVKWIGVCAVERWHLPNRRTAAIRREIRGKTGFVLEPARGVHLLRAGGAWVLLDRGKEEGAGKHLADSVGIPSIETIALRTWGRDPRLLQAMVAEAVEYGRDRFSEESLVRIGDQWGGWLEMPEVPTRSMESLVLPDRMGEELLGRLRTFLAASDWYAERGVPWRIGVGLYGPPGNGKSSLARALCGALKIPLHIVSINSRGMDDGSLLRLMANIGSGSAVLLDDIDAARLPSRTEAESEGVTLAGLLAALDGPGAGEGRILFMCTNHPERLDGALIRPGRIDIALTLAPATAEQAHELYRRWFPGAPSASAAAFAATGTGQSMAELQGQLMRLSSSATLQPSATCDTIATCELRRAS